MRRIAHILALLLSVLLAIGLALSYLSVHISPSIFWPIGLVGLAYPFLLLANLAMLIYWVIRWRLGALIPLLAILLGLGHLLNFFQAPIGRGPEATGPTLRVMTYNVNLFQLSPWAQTPPTHSQIFRVIGEQNPDIVAIQEFYVVAGRLTQQQAIDRLGYYAHIAPIVRRRNSMYGMATFSRFPIVGTGAIEFANSANACIYTDVRIGGDTVRVYNIHLQSLRLQERNLSFLLDQDFRRENNSMEEIQDITLRYRDAIVRRAQQVELVTRHIQSSPHPVIVCGDFNESPISYNYRRMRGGLEDSFVGAGIGVGHTYQGLSLSFPLRIDYILHSPSFRAITHRVLQVPYSDHYPVVSDLVIVD